MNSTLGSFVPLAMFKIFLVEQSMGDLSNKEEPIPLSPLGLCLMGAPLPWLLDYLSAKKYNSNFFGTSFESHSQ